jgi:hypothetical protein
MIVPGSPVITGKYRTSVPGEAVECALARKITGRKQENNRTRTGEGERVSVHVECKKPGAVSRLGFDAILKDRAFYITNVS